MPLFSRTVASNESLVLFIVSRTFVQSLKNMDDTILTLKLSVLQSYMINLECPNKRNNLERYEKIISECMPNVV